MKKIAILGGTGFLGTAVCNKLKKIITPVGNFINEEDGSASVKTSKLLNLIFSLKRSISVSSSSTKIIFGLFFLGIFLI